MRLIILNPKHLDLDDFCRYLINYIPTMNLSFTDLNAKLISKWNDYLYIIFPDLKDFDVYNIIKFFLNNQIYFGEKDNYIIETDKNIKILDIKLERLIQTIEEGTLDILGYPIFTDIYKHLAELMPILYQMWEGLV